MDTSKIIQALCYVANSQPDATIDTMKAYKLLWLADRWHLRNGGRTITGDDYWALPYGPVPSDAKNLVDGKKTRLSSSVDFYSYLGVVSDHKIKAKTTPYMSVFSDSDIYAMDLILKMYGDKTAIELSNLSHRFPEWKNYEEMLSDANKKNGYLINKDLFFENYDDGTGLFVDDIQQMNLAKEYFHLYRNS